MITVTKCFDFCYAHHLPKYEGNCKRVHGHNSRLEVTVVRNDGEDFDDETGFVIDFKYLKEIVERHVITQLDHTNLNDYFDNPTSETVVAWIVNKLSFKIMQCTRSKVSLHRVRMYETPDSYTEWTK